MCMKRTGRRTRPSSNNSMWSALRCHESSLWARRLTGGTFPHAGRDLNGKWQGGRWITAGGEGALILQPRTHAQTHWHMRTHAHDNIVLPEYSFNFRHTWRKHTGGAHSVNTPPYMNDDAANNCFVAHFLQCHLKVSHSYQHFPPHSIHPVLSSTYFFRHFGAAHSVPSFLFFLILFFLNIFSARA